MKIKLPSQLVPLCLELVHDVGKMLLRYQRQCDDLKITTKDAQGVASTADYESENRIITRLSKAFPHVPFLAEESAYLISGGEKTDYLDELKREWLWIIDPLDGTNNYLNGLGYYAISVALCHRGDVVFGMIHRPSTGETYYAKHGEKTRYLDGVSTRAKTLWLESNKKKIKNGLFATGFITEKGLPHTDEFELFKQMMAESRGIRRMGSACLDLCGVAKGQFDGFWERGLPPWDLAAAQIICQQSGVKLTNYNGQAFRLGDAAILAARAPLHGQLKKIIRAHMPV